MDIIAAHQHGLLEKLDEEVAALAGRGGDHGQRAVVLHHLYDHSGGAHRWALTEARRSVLTAQGLDKLRRKAGRWGWPSRARDEARQALDLLERAIGEAARARTAAAYRAYRLSATPPLWVEAERCLAPSLLSALSLCHAARRERSDLADETLAQLVAESEALAAAAVDTAALDRAWAAIDASGLRRAARRLFDAQRLARDAARAGRKGWAQAERALRDHPSLPAAFRANPAQHFYALQHTLAERRRQAWREAADRDEDAVALAA